MDDGNLILEGTERLSEGTIVWRNFDSLFYREIVIIHAHENPNSPIL
jgi:hypothetical protein